MSFDGDIKQWKCGKGSAVNLKRVSSIVRDIGEPCLHQSPIKINKMLKPDKWQATFDGDGKVFGFHKVLKLIILGGVDPSIRPQVWEFLLGCYALGSTAEYRRQLRTARRERYRDLIKQCQMMHSSIGTGSLAYVVGSKVMDMRTSSKDEGITEAEVRCRHLSDADTNKLDSYTNGNNGCSDTLHACKKGSCSDSGDLVLDMRTSSKDEGIPEAEVRCRHLSDADTNKLDSYTNGNNGCSDTSHACKKGSFSDSGDLVSVRGSTNGAAYDSSCFLSASPTSSPYKCSSPKPGEETFESNYPSESYYDFPPLPVTNLFEKRKKNKKGCRSLDEGLPTRRRLRFGDEHMHSFRISNNADLVVESSNSAINDILRSSNSEIEVVSLGGNDPVSWSGNLTYETEMLNRLRISDAPETPAINAPTSQGGTVNEDRVSEWLWTLHQIVVDVVRTDSHLEFYEDTKNLARMSDILAVYAWVDPTTGYCQGMSDLLSPFVVLFEDNADAFWCFEMLLRRMRENFQMEGPTGVMKQLQALWHILELTDKEMFCHLSIIGAESLHFAFRMLLVLFRRELSFNEALSMWEMIWAADFDESLAYHLEDNCPELLVIQIPRDSGAKMELESIETNSGSKSDASSKKGNLEHSVSDNTGIKSASAHPFCGLAKTFWSRNDRLHVGTALSTMGNGDDELPVFCVAAILIMNRQKIIRETHSIDDLIKGQEMHTYSHQTAEEVLLQADQEQEPSRSEC